MQAFKIVFVKSDRLIGIYLKKKSLAKIIFFSFLYRQAIFHQSDSNKNNLKKGNIRCEEGRSVSLISQPLTI